MAQYILLDPEYADVSVSVLGVRITAKDVVKFLQEKGAASTPCVVCQETDWALVLSPGDGSYMQIPTFGAETDAQHLPTYGTSCMNCGLFRLHGYGAVTAWKNDQVMEQSGG